jgi:hypothetical protein
LIQPETGVAEITRWDPLHREVIVRVELPSELRLKTYNFRGWTARIDGESVPVSSDKDGIQVISVPPGRHKIESDFGDTPPRRVGGALFGLGLIVIVGLAATDYRGRLKVRSNANMEQGRATERHASKTVGRRKTKVVLASLIALTVLVGALSIYRWRHSDGKSSSSDTSRTGAAPDAAIRGSLALNTEARLYVSGLESIPVAVDENALSEMMNALPIGKNQGVDELIRSGRLFRIPNNTRVRIIEVGSAKFRVRVLEGDSVALDGWVPERWVR